MWATLWRYFFPDEDQDAIEALIMNVEPERTPTLHDVMIDNYTTDKPSGLSPRSVTMSSP